MKSALPFLCKGEQLTMLPQKALFWPSRSTLIISDVHFGKVTHFRKYGIAIPANATRDNFVRLNALLEEVKPQKVLFLGDLFHSDHNHEWEEFGRLTSSFEQIEFVLVKGNHDIISNTKLIAYCDHVIEDGLDDGPFYFTHEPMKHDSLYTLCGHIHPAARIGGRARQSLRLPCFHFSEHIGILPAFGNFTGTYIVKPEPEDSVFVIAEDEILRIS